MVSKVLDVPFGTHFEHHETWSILSTSDTAIKSILRVTDRVKFLKSTIFESKIRSRSKEEFVMYFDKWIKAVEERGYLECKEEQVKLQRRNSARNSKNHSG